MSRILDLHSELLGKLLTNMSDWKDALDDYINGDIQCKSLKEIQEEMDEFLSAAATAMPTWKNDE